MFFVIMARAPLASLGRAGEVRSRHPAFRPHAAKYEGRRLEEAGGKLGRALATWWRLSTRIVRVGALWGKSLEPAPRSYDI